MKKIKSKFISPLVVTFLLALELVIGTASIPVGNDPCLKQEYNTTVYVTPHGECYHCKNCRTIANSRKVTATTRGKAEADGRRRCKVCKP